MAVDMGVWASLMELRTMTTVARSRQLSLAMGLAAIQFVAIEMN
jgi:hypothetical protein